jgi:hypothetical protein
VTKLTSNMPTKVTIIYICYNDMRILRVPIADEIRQEVVTKWLGGWARDKIAREIGIGAGTVTNLIANWTNEI